MFKENGRIKPEKEDASKDEFASVECPHCGAKNKSTNVVFGEFSPCEKCGKDLNN